MFNKETEKLIEFGTIFNIKTFDKEEYPLPSKELLDLLWILKRLSAMQGAEEEKALERMTYILFYSNSLRFSQRAHGEKLLHICTAYVERFLEECLERRVERPLEILLEDYVHVHNNKHTWAYAFELSAERPKTIQAVFKRTYNL